MARKSTTIEAFADVAASVLFVLAGSLFGGCSSEGSRMAMLQAVGRPCNAMTDAEPAQGSVSTITTTCPSQVCIKPVVQQGASGSIDTGALCTAECSQDSDCLGELRDPTNPNDKRCSRGFACGIPFAVGPVCCKKLCVCKDFLGPSGLTVPSACTDSSSSPGACGGASSDQSVGSPIVEVQTDIYVSLSPVRQLDLLVMVDNSPGMAPKVSKLNLQFPRLINALKNPTDGTLPDLRVTVIDSDLGTGNAYASGSCGPKPLPDGDNSPYGDRGRFQMLKSPYDCNFDDGALFLEYKTGTAQNYIGDINSVFACLTGNLGTLGCGFEHQLQAFEFALAAKGVGNDEQQSAFLRPNAQLGLLFLTDEDDCSPFIDNGLFGDKPELRGETASLRCATRSHACMATGNLADNGPHYPTIESFEAPFAECTARMGDECQSGSDLSNPTNCNPLRSVRALAEEMKSLKGNPDNQILVAGIFGWPRNDYDLEDAVYKIAPVPNPNTADTQHPTVYDYWPICYDPDHLPKAPDPETGFDVDAAGWGATGGLRNAAFVDEFGKNGLKFSACERDYSVAMQEIGTALAKQIQNLCIDYKLIDRDDDPTNGVQADCRVVLRVPMADPNNPTRVTYEEVLPALPQCPAGAADGSVSATCWALVSDKNACPNSGQLVTILRTAADIAANPRLLPGTKLGMQCRTCPGLFPAAEVPAGCRYSL